MFPSGIQAIALINEAINKGDENETVEALQLPAAKLRDIQSPQAFHYQVLLARHKDRKAEVRLGLAGQHGNSLS